MWKEILIEILIDMERKKMIGIGNVCVHTYVHTYYNSKQTTVQKNKMLMKYMHDEIYVLIELWSEL